MKNAIKICTSCEHKNYNKRKNCIECGKTLICSPRPMKSVANDLKSEFHKEVDIIRRANRGTDL